MCHKTNYFGHYLKDCRLTQRKQKITVAGHLGVGTDFYDKIERGKAHFTDSEIFDDLAEFVKADKFVLHMTFLKDVGMVDLSKPQLNRIFSTLGKGAMI